MVHTTQVHQAQARALLFSAATECRSVLADDQHTHMPPGSDLLANAVPADTSASRINQFGSSTLILFSQTDPSADTGVG